MGLFVLMYSYEWLYREQDNQHEIKQNRKEDNNLLIEKVNKSSDSCLLAMNVHIGKPPI